MSHLNMDAGGGFGAGGKPSLAAPEAAGLLHQELGKWRERVPRLVAALRERTEEVARLQAELASARPGAGPAPGPTVRARDAIIGELESELSALRDSHAALQGDLHARTLTIDGLKRDLAGWKFKWQELALLFDETAAQPRHDPGLVDELDRVRSALRESEAERESLQTRNAQLFETTDLANRQLEVLADDLAELRGQLKVLRSEHAGAVRERDALTAECARLAADRDAARAELEESEALMQVLQAAAREGAAADDRLADRIRALEGDCAQSARALAVARAHSEALEQRRRDAEHGRADAEHARTEAEVARAAAEAGLTAARQAALDAATAQRDAEAVRQRLEHSLRETRAELVRTSAEQARAAADLAAAREGVAPLEARFEAQSARLRQLEHQLSERSALVLGLEQELKQRDARLGELEHARLEGEEALLRANRHAREQADYIVQLDDRNGRQKELLLGLEQELASVQTAGVAAQKRQEALLGERDAELRALRLQVTALQDMLESRETPATSPVRIDDGIRTERDTRTLTILNQQLRDARARSAQLLEQLRRYEQVSPGVSARPAGSGPGPEPGAGESATLPGDDLTRIRGVGPRLAQHLRELGVTRFGQIAELDPAALDDPRHALAGLKARILRDGWIRQAGVLQGL